MRLSAIICAHNPRPEHIGPTLAHLAAQEGLPQGAELILLDNASDRPLAESVDLFPLSRFASVRVVREERLGLTHARIRSFHEAQGDVLVYVDDDNLLASDYLAKALAAFDRDPDLGAVGGKSIPRYAADPPKWFAELGLSLACRDLGDAPLSAEWNNGDRTYPACAPIGAGMAVRRQAYAAWVEAASGNARRSALGRRGADLSSGEDNDMVLTILAGGWRVAYLPELVLTHMIPEGRLRPEYLARYAETSNRTWVQVLDVHGICPWPPIPAWTVPFRRAKSYLAQRAWRSPADRIRWRAACGLYAGQASIGGAG